MNSDEIKNSIHSVQEFSPEVVEKLKYYVYRLIDPRNAETFYVGKGKGNRVFAHSRADLGKEGDELSDKLYRIREIRADGFEVSHIIHRHGMSEDQTLEVEAALIEAYPTVNEIRGIGPERGIMHVDQIIRLYGAKEAVFSDKLLLITINRSLMERNTIYSAVQFAWRLNPEKARKADYVLAIRQGLIIGVFVAEKWLPATFENFPGMPSYDPHRWGFIGKDAPPEVVNRYLNHRVPAELQKKGAANPARYVNL